MHNNEPSVDFHTQVPDDETPTAAIVVRNNCLVEAYDQQGQTVAKATRAGIGTAWYIGKLIDGKMINVAEIHPWVPEHLARRMVLETVTLLTEV